MRDLLTLSRLISSAESLEKIDDQFGRIILSVSESDRVTISLPDPTSNSAHNLLVFGDEIPNLSTGAAHPPLADEEPRWLQEDSAYHVDAAMRQEFEIVRWSEEVALAVGLQSTMVAPVQWQGQTIAAITFRSRNIDNYQASHLDIATQISNQIAGAIAGQVALKKSLAVANEREILAKISRIATNSVDLNATFKIIANEVQELVPWDRIAVTAFQTDGPTEEYIFQAGVEFDSTVANRWSTVADDMVDLFDKDPTPLIVDHRTMSTSSDLLRGYALGEASGLKSWLLVPLTVRNKHIGHIHFRSLEENAYSEYHIEISAQISSQISGAIAGSLANENLAREVRERTTLAEISRLLTSGTQIVDEFEKFAHLSKSLIPSDRISISRNSEAANQYFPFLEHGVPFEGIEGDEYKDTRQGITDRIRTLIGPAVMSDIPHDSGEDIQNFNRFAKNAGLNSWLVAPLFWRDELIGSIHFRSKLTNAYSDRYAGLAGEIAAQLVGHIASTDAYEQLDRESTVRRVLAELGKVIASTDDFLASMHHIEKLIAQIITSDGFSLGQIDLGAQTIRRLHATGLYNPASEVQPEFDLSESSASKAVVSKTVVRQSFTSVEEIKQFPKSVGAYNAGARSFLTAPLISNDQIVGAMQFRSTSLDAFSDAEVDYAKRLADQISGALANWKANQHSKQLHFNPPTTPSLLPHQLALSNGPTQHSRNCMDGIQLKLSVRTPPFSNQLILRIGTKTKKYGQHSITEALGAEFTSIERKMALNFPRN